MRLLRGNQVNEIFMLKVTVCVDISIERFNEVEA